MGHHVGDVDRTYYRSKEEEHEWRRRDPLELAKRWLLDEAVADEATLAEIDVRVTDHVAAAVEAAIAAPFPSPDEVGEHVYA